MTIRQTTRPADAPALRYPLDLAGYELVPGRKYHRLAQVDRVTESGEAAGHSVLAFVEFPADGGEPVLYRAKGWKQCGARMAASDAAYWRPYVDAAKAALDGTGPATWCRYRNVEVGEGYTGRSITELAH